MLLFCLSNMEIGDIKFAESVEWNVSFAYCKAVKVLSLGMKLFVMQPQISLLLVLFEQLQPPDASEIRVLRGHQLPITCLVITPDDKYIFSAAKDCSIIKCESYSIQNDIVLRLSVELNLAVYNPVLLF